MRGDNNYSLHSQLSRRCFQVLIYSYWKFIQMANIKSWQFYTDYYVALIFSLFRATWWIQGKHMFYTLQACLTHLCIASYVCLIITGKLNGRKSSNFLYVIIHYSWKLEKQSLHKSWNFCETYQMDAVTLNQIMPDFLQIFKKCTIRMYTSFTNNIA